MRGQEKQVQTEEVHTGYQEKHFLHKDSLALEHIAETLYSLTLKPPKTVNAQILEFLGLISELNSALSRKLEEKHPVVPSNMNYPVILKSPANFGNKVSEFLKCRLPINDAHRKNGLEQPYCLLLSAPNIFFIEVETEIINVSLFLLGFVFSKRTPFDENTVSHILNLLKHLFLVLPEQ